MPNGKHGDHPVTDVVVHGLPVFSASIDTLIKELHALGLWTSQIASEWIYGQYWDLRQTQQTAGQDAVVRFFDHMQDVLESEVERLSKACS